jgi:uncharacterized protein
MTTTAGLRTVVEHASRWIPLADGRRLHTLICLPDDAEQRPVGAVLTYEPYPIRWATASRDERMQPALAAHGFAAVRVDIAGSGESDGVLHDEYLQSELDDAVEVIDWIARQPWCNGSVGMKGLSWGGFNSLMVAALRPESLKAIISACATDDRYADDVHYNGGCLMAADAVLWAAFAHAFLAAPPDAAVVGDAWRKRWLERLQVEPLVLPWLTHQLRDEYWRHASVCEDYDAIACPVLMVGGFEDAYRGSVFRMLDALRERAWGLVGPWGHCWPQDGAPAPTLDFAETEARWWRHWLDGGAEDVEDWPRLTTYVQDSRRPREHLVHRPGGWVEFDRWSSAAATYVSLPASGAGGGQSPREVRWRGDLGMGSPANCPYGLPSDFAEDQRGEDALAACFDWELEQPLAIVGPPSARLRLAADAERAMVALRLCDVAPDGASTLITHGLRNLTHAEGHDRVTPLRPGEEIEVEVGLLPTGYRVPAGHRLRLAVSPGWWPLAWPSPDPVTLRIDPEGTTLRLPTAEGSRAVDLREAASPEESQASLGDDAGTRRRWVERSFDDSRVRLHAVGDRPAGHGSAGTSRMVDTTLWEIDPEDPLSAFTRTAFRLERAGPDWEATVDLVIEVRGDPEALHVTSSLRGLEGTEVVHQREHSWTIPRQGM